MIRIGEYNRLKAVRQTDNGVYLVDKKETGEVLLPNKFIPEDLYEDDIIEVFVFKDHEGRLTATTQKPKITLHKFAYLQARDVNEYGAFMDWGLDKDLLVPFREQSERMEAGKFYIVYLYIDGISGRLVGTSRYLRYLKNKHIELDVDEEVDLLIDNETVLGVNVIINDRYQGLVYSNEFFHKLKRGDRCKGFIKHIRHDNRIDVVFNPNTFDRISSSAQKILALIRKRDGFLPYHDKTDAGIIRKELEMSKKTFKQAIGGLYSRRKIRIEKDGLYLVQRSETATDHSEEE